MLKTIRSTWRVATFKRELSVIMLAFVAIVALVYVVRIFVFTPSDPAMVTSLGVAFSSIFSVLVTTVMSFAGVAFGIDAWVKQIQPGKDPQP